MTFRLGLTGSIGMGKSTTAAMFAARGFPVWDADKAVHRLYAPGGAAVAPVTAAFPTAAKRDGGIDRGALRAAVSDDPAALQRLEAIVHPLVATDREESHVRAREAQARIAVYDIPLLYETGGEATMHGVAVVSADSEAQQARVLSRPGMTRDMMTLILARQMPDSDKRSRADWIIPTDTLAGAEAAVDQICDEILSRPDPEAADA